MVFSSKRDSKRYKYYSKKGKKMKQKKLIYLNKSQAALEFVILTAFLLAVSLSLYYLNFANVVLLMVTLSSLFWYFYVVFSPIL